MKKYLLIISVLIFFIAGCSDDDNPSNNSTTIKWNISDTQIINGDSTTIGVNAEFTVKDNNISGNGLVIYSAGFANTVSTDFSGTKTSDEVELDGTNSQGEDYFSYSGDRVQIDGNTFYLGNITIYEMDTLVFKDIQFPY